MDPLAEERQEAIPSAPVCLDGIARHLQAYEATIDRLTRENAELRQQLALVLQKLEEANAQAVRYAFLLQEAQPGAQGASPAPAPAPAAPASQARTAPAQGAPAARPGPGSVYATVVGARQGSFAPGGKAAPALGGLPAGRDAQLACVGLTTYVIHNRAVHSLIFASNYLITSSRDGSTRGWVLPPEAVGRIPGAQGTPEAAGVALRTYRCDSPVVSAAMIEGRLVLSDARGQVQVYASPVRCLEGSTPYADVDSVEADLLRPDRRRRGLLLPAPAWCFCPAPSGILCLGGGHCSYLVVGPSSYEERVRLPVPGPERTGPFQGELLFPTHLAALGSRHFVAVRERYADPNGAMRDAANVPSSLQELQGLRRTGLRLFRLAPAALAAAGSSVPAPTPEQPLIWDQAVLMAPGELDVPGPLQPTGLAAMSPLEGTAGILLASTTCPAARLLASDGACLVRCEFPDSPQGEAFSAIAVHGGRLYATPFCADGASPKLNVYCLDSDSRLALKEIASRAVSAAKASGALDAGAAAGAAGGADHEGLPPLLFGDSFPALSFCLVGSFVLDEIFGPALSIAARDSYDGKLVVVAVGGRDGEVCVKGISE